MRVIKDFSTIYYGDETYKIEVPLELNPYNLLLGRTQLIKLESDFVLQCGQKVEVTKHILDSIYVYPVVVVGADKPRSSILLEADYSLDINRIGEIMSMETFSRRKEWPPDERIISFDENGKRTIFNSVKGKNWLPSSEDFKNDWAVILCCFKN